MIKNRSIQVHHRQLASELIRRGMRASLIAAILDMSLPQARQLYEEITGRSSPSGQTPRSNDYYFAPVMRLHAATFIRLYQCLAPQIKETREAFISAYAHYCGLWGRPRMPIDRAWRLLQLFRQADGTIRVAHCSAPRCRAYTLVQAHEGATRYTCPACQGSLEVSKRLRGKSGRKHKPASPPAASKAIGTPATKPAGTHLVRPSTARHTAAP